MIKEIKLTLISMILEASNHQLIEALYEILVNEDYDYIPDLFNNADEFKEFIEKWKPRVSEDDIDDTKETKNVDKVYKKKEIFHLAAIKGVKTYCSICHKMKDIITIEDRDWHYWNICEKCFLGDK